MRSNALGLVKLVTILLRRIKPVRLIKEKMFNVMFVLFLTSLAITPRLHADDEFAQKYKGGVYYEKPNGEQVIYGGQNGQGVTREQYINEGRQIAETQIAQHEAMWGQAQMALAQEAMKKNAANDSEKGLIQKQVEAQVGINKQIAQDLRADQTKRANDVMKEQFVKPKTLVSLEKRDSSQ